jgi:hypothetical protein
MCLLAPLLFAACFADEPKLTADDAKFLDRLLTECLFDPTGAERVRGKFPYYSVYSNATFTLTREGWWIRGKNGKLGRVYFSDGWSLPAPEDLIAINFAAQSRKAYDKQSRPANQDDANESIWSPERDLIQAAWLHKLGHDDLAAKALAVARKERGNSNSYGTLRDELHNKLANESFDRLVEYYQVRDDDAAMEEGDRLFKLYRDIIRRDKRCWEAESILADLNRRKKAGTFGKDAARLTPATLPAGRDERIAALIVSLDEVNIERPMQGFMSHHTLGYDWRVQSLEEIGEPAILALFLAFETDIRRTRSPYYPSVREVIHFAIESILKEKMAPCPSDGECLAYPGCNPDKVKEAATKLRAYWDTYGKFPFDERMMKILTDLKSSDDACCSAASNLATLAWHSREGWLSGLFGSSLLSKFSNPTVAEAIVAAWDRLGDGRYFPDVLLRSLVELGDRRIASAVSKRAATATNLFTRIRLVETAFRLGEMKPLEDLAKEFEVGSIMLRELKPKQSGQNPYAPSEPSSESDLGRLILLLSSAHTPAADKALFALILPSHPYHQRTCDDLLQAKNDIHNCSNWYSHPYWLGIVRPMLDDTTPTGEVVYKVENGALIGTRIEDGKSRMVLRASLPVSLQETKLLLPEATERACDPIAVKVSESVFGFPPYHMLRIDGEQNLKTIKELLDRFGCHYRRLTWADAKSLEISNFFWDKFIPDIKSLQRGATADDVATGLAVFHFDGKGQPTKVKLPVVVVLKKEENGKTVRGLAVQAETAPNGTITYGVIFQHSMRAVPASEVEKVEPI